MERRKIRDYVKQIEKKKKGLKTLEGRKTRTLAILHRGRKRGGPPQEISFSSKKKVSKKKAD